MNMVSGGSGNTSQNAVWGDTTVSFVKVTGDHFTLFTRTDQGDLVNTSLESSEFSANRNMISGAAEDVNGDIFVSCNGLHSVSQISYSSLYPFNARRYSMWTYTRDTPSMTAPVIGEDGWMYLGYGNDIMAIGD